jgi:hypothetical protein
MYDVRCTMLDVRCVERATHRTSNIVHLLPDRLYRWEFRQWGIKMGRDKLNNLLSAHDLLSKKERKMAKTTNSNHLFRRYSDLQLTVPSW